MDLDAATGLACLLLLANQDVDRNQMTNRRSRDVTYWTVEEADV